MCVKKSSTIYREALGKMLFKKIVAKIFYASSNDVMNALMLYIQMFRYLTFRHAISSEAKLDDFVLIGVLNLQLGQAS